MNPEYTYEEELSCGKAKTKRKKGNRLFNGTWHIRLGNSVTVFHPLNSEFGIQAKIRTIFSNKKSIVVLFAVIQAIRGSDQL